jgi:hypothetical protein
MSDLYLGAYWPARKETIDACADRLLGFLTGLAALDPAFASWYAVGKSLRQSLQRPVEFRNKSALISLLERGRSRTDVGRQVMEELGFAFYLWNRREPGCELSLNGQCGVYSTYQGNCTLLDLPEQLEIFRHPERMAGVLALAARAWEPDWAAVISRRSRDARNYVVGKPFVDWLIYLSNERAPNLKAAQAHTVERVDDIGWLIVVQREPVDPGNPEHMQRVTAIERALGFSGSAEIRQSSVGQSSLER